MTTSKGPAAVALVPHTATRDYLELANGVKQTVLFGTKYRRASKSHLEEHFVLLICWEWLIRSVPIQWQQGTRRFSQSFSCSLHPQLKKSAFESDLGFCLLVPSGKSCVYATQE